LLTISFAFLSMLPKKPPARFGEPAGACWEVFSSHPPSPIMVLEAILIAGLRVRKGASGV
jgi:hypothetical protein